jgi:hydrogenase/urease accessory protein HupE
MAETVYMLCALTSTLCATLLIRSYRATRTRLLLLSSLSFVGLALNNVLLFVDLVMVPDVDLAVGRSLIAFAALLVLVYALIWETR